MSSKKKSSKSARTSGRGHKPSGRTTMQIVSTAGGSRSDFVVKFGSVTITSQKPDAAVISRSVTLGAEAFTRALSKMSSPGVTLETKPDVPTFRADPTDPKTLIRRLNGKEQRGYIRHGEFIVSE